MNRIKLAVRSVFLNPLFLIWILMVVPASCSKKDQAASGSTDLISYTIFPGKDISETDLIGHQITVRVPDTVYSGEGLAAIFQLSPGAGLTLGGVSQQSGVTKNNFEKDLNYTVTAQNLQTRIWKVQATNNNNSLPWGLGHFINRSLSTDRSYDWYIDQGNSGIFAPVNCGPASVTMAMKWADSGFSKSAVDARATFETDGGWWFTYDIEAYLTKYNITHAIIGLSSNTDSVSAILRSQLDHKQIIILCLDMNYVRSAGKSDFRVDKFYPTSPDWGHFIVIKGYQKVDGKVFFEAYDPFSFGNSNSDQTLKGRNRFYRNEDLAAATLNWWNFAFVIAKKGETLSTEATNRKLIPAFVPVAHSSGRIQ